MKILVAPLNWGLGHATRCIPLIRRWLAAGDEVVIAGNGTSLVLLRKYFPSLRWVRLADFEMRYSASSSQVGAIVRQIPNLFKAYLADYYALDNILKAESFDLVVSDNRFGFHSRRAKSVYLTHQLFIQLPHGWQWLRPYVDFFHHRIIAKYDECWVPDYSDITHSLSGILSHGKRLPSNVRYQGPLSRFEGTDFTPDYTYEVVVVVSGPEKQRTLFEQQQIERFRQYDGKVLILRGLPEKPLTKVRLGNVDLVPHLSDDKLASYLLGCKHIVSRCGYTSVMDMECLGVTDKVEWYATAGQPEQQYLLRLLTGAIEHQQ